MNENKTELKQRVVAWLSGYDSKHGSYDSGKEYEKSYRVYFTSGGFLYRISSCQNSTLFIAEFTRSHSSTCKTQKIVWQITCSAYRWRLV